ncbi:MAG TPA: hypothetical protein DCR35_19720 [Runella sp.]|nr:hypothetical protein [Runella sp.]HAO51338.1 hypothetical protein [Runella sp.]
MMTKMRKHKLIATIPQKGKTLIATKQITRQNAPEGLNLSRKNNANYPQSPIGVTSFAER